MTTMPPETPPPTSSPLRELVGLALLIVGVLAICTAAILVDPRLGIALGGAITAYAGYRLTVREV